MRVLVTGGAGFIGSHVVDMLVQDGHDVVVADNLSAGRMEHLHDSLDAITFVRADCGDPAVLDTLLPGVDAVWHLAANPDVRAGASDPNAHFDPNVGVTWRLLEAMRRHSVKRLLFTSTSTVYGAASVLPTPEHYGPLYPVSVYGGAKLACEALIASHSGSFGLNAILFRFANVVGSRSHHGVIVDFLAKLKANPDRLEILGDGKQSKSYVSIEDTVAAMRFADLHTPSTPAGACHAFNIGSLDAIPVTKVADVVAGVLGVRPNYAFTGGVGGAGWVGDVTRMRLDTARLEAMGWKAKHTSAEAVELAARALQAS